MHLSAGLLFFFFSAAHQTTAKKDKALYCSVCRALVNEVNGRIGDVDPKKMVQVGSFRVDPDGNQKLVQKQYARSEVHLTEIFEDVCRSMSDYVQIKGDDGIGSVVRRKSRAGADMDLSNARFIEDLGNKLKFYCESLLEDFEEEMIALFTQDSLPAIETAVCGNLANVCTEEELSRPVPTLSEKKERENNIDLEDYLEKEEEEDEESNILEHSENKGKASSDIPGFEAEKEEL